MSHIAKIVEERLDSMSADHSKTEVAKVVALARSEIKRAAKGDGIIFPVETFPKKIQDILMEFQKCSGLPLEYYFGYALGAVSGIVGNKYRVRFKSTYYQSPMLYMAVVGPPSVGKTPVMNRIFKPIYDIENGYQLKHKVAIDSWKQKKSELAMEGAKHELKELEEEKPNAKEILVEDTTIEYIAQALSYNPNGLILLRDEMVAWIKQFDAYKSGGAETQAWLEFWNNPSVKKIGRMKGNIYIRRPFITVIGGVQPGMLKDFAGQEKTENGFLARLLFVYPQVMERPMHSDDEPHEKVVDEYDKIIKYIYNLPSRIKHDETDGANGHTYDVEAINLPLTDAARKLYVKYRNDNIYLYNRSKDDGEKGMLGKIEMYALRLALILEIMERACEGKPNPDVSGSWFIEAATMKNAIILTNYFRDMAYKVMNKVDDPLSGLKDTERILYDSLPDEFPRKICMDAGKTLDWSESGVKRFLNKDKFFKKTRPGVYAKRYV